MINKDTGSDSVTNERPSAVTCEADLHCISLFNKLAHGDKLLLRAAAVTKAISGFIRDDTQAYPWRYPLYLAYMLVFSIPGLPPIPWFGTMLGAATIAFAKMEWGQIGRGLNKRLVDSWQSAALIRDHMPFIERSAEGAEEKFHVKSLALSWHIAVAPLADMASATGHAINSLGQAGRNVAGRLQAGLF